MAWSIFFHMVQRLVISHIHCKCFSLLPAMLSDEICLENSFEVISTALAMYM